MSDEYQKICFLACVSALSHKNAATLSGAAFSGVNFAMTNGPAFSSYYQGNGKRDHRPLSRPRLYPP